MIVRHTIFYKNVGILHTLGTVMVLYGWLRKPLLARRSEGPAKRSCQDLLPTGGISASALSSVPAILKHGEGVKPFLSFGFRKAAKQASKSPRTRVRGTWRRGAPRQVAGSRELVGGTAGRRPREVGGGGPLAPCPATPAPGCWECKGPRDRGAPLTAGVG